MVQVGRRAGGVEEGPAPSPDEPGGGAPARPTRASGWLAERRGLFSRSRSRSLSASRRPCMQSTAESRRPADQPRKPRAPTTLGVMEREEGDPLLVFSLPSMSTTTPASQPRSYRCIIVADRGCGGEPRAFHKSSSRIHLISSMPSAGLALLSPRLAILSLLAAALDARRFLVSHEGGGEART